MRELVFSIADTVIDLAALSAFTKKKTQRDVHHSQDFGTKTSPAQKKQGSLESN